MGKKGDGAGAAAVSTKKKAVLAPKSVAKEGSAAKKPTPISKSVVKKIVKKSTSTIMNSPTKTTTAIFPNSKSRPRPRSAIASLKTVKSSSVSKVQAPSKVNQKSTSPVASNSKANSTVSTLISGSRLRSDKTGAATVPKIPVDRDKSLMNIVNDFRLHGFSEVMTVVQKGTPKVKQLLLNECDFILECRLCRNLFRSLSNFISHKTNYCKTFFHVPGEDGCSRFLQSSNDVKPSITYQYKLPPPVKAEKLLVASTTRVMGQDDEASNEKDCNGNNIQEYCPVVVAENGTQSALSLYKNIEELTDDKANIDTSISVNLAFEPVGGRSDLVMFQSKAADIDPSLCDSQSSTYDNRTVQDRDSVLLAPDGRELCTGSARAMEKIVRHLSAQIELSKRRMIENGTSTKEYEFCDICRTYFPTEKGFRQHRRDSPDCAKQSPWTKDSIRNGAPKKSTSESPPLKRYKIETDELKGNCSSSLSSTAANYDGSAAKPTNSPDLNYCICYHCSRWFSSMPMLSLHLPGCSGRKQNVVSAPKIGIEVRHSFPKPHKTITDVGTPTNLSVSSPSSSAIIEGKHLGKQQDGINDKLVIQRKRKARKPAVVNKLSTMLVEDDPIPSEYLTVNTNPPNGNGLLISSDSPSPTSDGGVEAETVSNTTDSGISSTTGINDDLIELPLFPTPCIDYGADDVAVAVATRSQRVTATKTPIAEKSVGHSSTRKTAQSRIINETQNTSKRVRTRKLKTPVGDE